MKPQPITPATLSQSVIAVPPLARNADGSFNRGENRKLIRHLEAGGVSTLLYGGNAILAHVAISEYAELLAMLTELAGENSLVIPSVGPGYGMMRDQARILREFSFPTAMMLPSRDVVTSDGVATALRKFVEALGRPAVLYIKNDGYIEVDAVRRLANDGLLSWIKYATVRDNPVNDAYLRQLVNAVGASLIVSGIGEQPALPHLREFGLIGYTSGCVCVAPKLSMDMLHAMKAGDFATAERIQTLFRPLEDLRNAINPIRVLHTAVRLIEIADTGPLIPLLSEIDESQHPMIHAAASQLLKLERQAARA
jgi:dihydrodipicolinate synthase/N-acetylneuraminate lyase